MTRSEGVVSRVEGEWAWVAVCKASACGQCDSQKNCGSGLLAEALGPREYRVANDGGARVGDEVILSVRDGSVARAAAISYLGPLALAIVGALAGNAFAGDPGALAGVFLGLALGAGFLRAANRWFASAAEPGLSMSLKANVIQLDRETT
ncbi:MAG TPA: SoxR reducing system RseC family protein [Rhodocyclaceae bacterium]|nr:SoxR reducing system RseC family protein [Rhodocyclaceae bacterium]